MPKLSADERVLYATAVWETFIGEHKVKRLTMTSAEFNVVRNWMGWDAKTQTWGEAIPLPVVFRGITETSKPKTLLACAEPVKRAEAYWFSAMGGL